MRKTLLLLSFALLASACGAAVEEAPEAGSAPTTVTTVASVRPSESIPEPTLSPVASTTSEGSQGNTEASEEAVDAMDKLVEELSGVEPGVSDETIEEIAGFICDSYRFGEDGRIVEYNLEQMWGYLSPHYIHHPTVTTVCPEFYEQAKIAF